MNKLVITNVSIYKAIAEEAYAQMMAATKNGRTPKPDGAGCILHYDPHRISLKKSMVTVVFTGMWLEALIHLLIIRDYGEDKYREYDRKSYEDKLRLLGIQDEALLSQVTQFRATRKELVHEKAYFDSGAMKIAQDEAAVAYEIMRKVEALLV